MVKRLTPEIGSIPIVLSSRPKTAAAKALTRFPPPSEATVERPNMASAQMFPIQQVPKMSIGNPR